MGNITSLEDLMVDHDYSCHNQNRHDNYRPVYEDWASFSMNWDCEDDDTINRNLIFRWDVGLTVDMYGEDLSYLGIEKKTEYYMQVNIIQQAKGAFVPILIFNLTQEDVPEIVAMLNRHWNRMKNIWSPFK